MTRIEKDLLNYKSSYIDENGVLLNKLGITNQEELDIAERMITTRKLALMYDIDVTDKRFDAAYYFNIHKELFHHIYSFAGIPRNESITKSFSFCLPQFIYPNLVETLNKASKKIQFITNRDELLDFIVELYSELDFIHPFREGNGRTLREFIRQYMKYICIKNNLENYTLDYSLTDRDTYLKAIIKADSRCDYTDLRNLFDSIMITQTKDIKKM